MLQETFASPISVLKSLTAGSLGGASFVLVGHPLDTVKVRLQTMPTVSAGEPALYRGMVDCMRKTVSADGVTGLYKGMGSVLMGISPIYAVCFFGYNWGRSLFIQNPTNPRKHEVLFAGFFAGLFTTSIVAPVERVKCLLQVQSSTHSPKLYAGPVDAVWKLYRTGGLRSLYTGTAATLLRDIPGTGVYFLTYESIKEALKGPGDSSNRLSFGRILLAGGVAGLLDWLVALVPDFLKSRYQSAPDGRYPRGIRSVLAELMGKEGLHVLFRGATPLLLRAFTANAACFLGYELSLELLDSAFPHL